MAEESEQENQEDEDEVQDSELTTSTDYRWKYLATLLAIFIGVGFPLITAFHAVGYVDITIVPQWAWLPIISGWVGTMIYALGEDIRDVWNDSP